MEKAIILGIIFWAAIRLEGQEVNILKKGDAALSKKITLTEQHRYSVNLGKNKFVCLVVDQKGIDLQVKVVDPTKDLLKIYDSPNGTFGPEDVCFHSYRKSGTYEIIVEPLGVNKAIEEGAYSIELVQLEKAAKSIPRKIDQLMASWDRLDRPGAAIGVIQNGELVIKTSYGAANLEYRQPLTTQSLFQVASVSKQFTAFAIAFLAEQGKIDLNADIRTYLPDLPEFEATVTVDHLVHHTSGIKDLFNFLAIAGWTGDDYISKDHVLNIARNHTALNFKPGEEYMYSNTGYALMAAIVEAVTEEAFPKWMKENIFTPLQMNATFFNDNYARLIPKRANAYYQSEGQYYNDLLVYSSVGETGLYTTVEDLAKWLANFEQHRLGTKELHQKIRKSGLLNNGDAISYGFGLRLTKYKELDRISHGGSHSGYRTFTGYFPEKQLGVIVLSNAGGQISPTSKAMQIADLFLEDHLSSVEIPETTKSKKPQHSLPPDLFNNYNGVFKMSNDTLVEFWEKDGSYYSKINGKQPRTMWANSDSTFSINNDIGIVFERNPSKGIATTFTLHKKGDQQLTGVRLEEPLYDSLPLEAYEGVYYSEEAQTKYKLVIQDDKLMAIHQRHAEILLERVNRNYFSTNRWFFRQIDFEQDKNGAITGFYVSNSRVRNIYFKK